MSKEETYDVNDEISRSGSVSASKATPSRPPEEENVEIDVVSNEGDDSGLDSEQRALLRYKTKIKKNFKSPKVLKTIEDQRDKVEKSILAPKKQRPKDPALNTPSSVMPMPSDFEHVFHAQELSKPQEEAREKEREKERKEQELLKRVLQRISKASDPVIPIYIGDDSQPTKVLNMPLARLNELNKIMGKGAISSVKKIQPMPTVKPLTKLSPVSLPVRPDLPFKREEQSQSFRRELSPLIKSSAAKAVSGIRPGSSLKSAPIQSSLKSAVAKSTSSKAGSKSSSIKPLASGVAPKSSSTPKSAITKSTITKSAITKSTITKSVTPKSATLKSTVRSSSTGPSNLINIRTKEVKKSSKG